MTFYAWEDDGGDLMSSGCNSKSEISAIKGLFSLLEDGWEEDNLKIYKRASWSKRKDLLESVGFKLVKSKKKFDKPDYV